MPCVVMSKARTGQDACSAIPPDHGYAGIDEPIETLCDTNQVATYGFVDSRGSVQLLKISRIVRRRRSCPRRGLVERCISGGRPDRRRSRLTFDG